MTPKKPLKFEPVVTTHWECGDRFRINDAYPSGYCAQDLYSYDEELGDYTRREFTKTFEEAVAWCEGRPA